MADDPLKEILQKRNRSFEYEKRAYNREVKSVQEKAKRENWSNIRYKRALSLEKQRFRLKQTKVVYDYEFDMLSHKDVEYVNEYGWGTDTQSAMKRVKWGRQT